MSDATVPQRVAQPIGSVQEGTFKPSGTTITDLSSGRGSSAFGKWADPLGPEEYADQVAQYEAQEAAAAQALEEEEAAMAMLEEEEAALVTAEGIEEVAMIDEAAMGPLGWIMEGLTAAALLATAGLLAETMLEQGGLEKEMIDHQPSKIPTPQRPVITHPQIADKPQYSIYGGFYPLRSRRRRRK